MYAIRSYYEMINLNGILSTEGLLKISVLVLAYFTLISYVKSNKLYSLTSAGNIEKKGYMGFIFTASEVFDRIIFPLILIYLLCGFIWGIS